MEKFFWTLLLVNIGIVFVNGESTVHILAGNMEQFVTSTTLEWVPRVPRNENDKEILKNAVIAAYQIIAEPKDNEAAVTENDTGNGLVSKPVYVCRAKINSVWVVGQLRPIKHVCVVSHYRKVSEHDHFDILVSIEDSARLSWVNKETYTILSQGAVTSGENLVRTFVARRATKNHGKEASLTHYVGKFNPSENLGVFHVVDQNNDEIQFEDGEVLVETEPIGYELKSIKYQRTNKRQQKNKRVLGFATLKNEENGLQRVDSVISFNYTYSLYWGKGHGMLTGLPFNVSLPNGTQIHGAWAIRKDSEVVEVAPIEKYLEAGTAVNVTLTGNYTEMEIPYTATVVLYYADNGTREITIRDTKIENKMVDIVTVYDPAYFIHNNTLVPTTTTTTTSTTTTTTKTTTQEVIPMSPPQVVIKDRKSDGPSSIEGKHENGSMLSDQENSKHDNASSLKKGDPQTRESVNGGTASRSVMGMVTSLVLAVIVCRVT